MCTLKLPLIKNRNSPFSGIFYLRHFILLLLLIKLSKSPCLLFYFQTFNCSNSTLNFLKNFSKILLENRAWNQKIRHSPNNYPPNQRFYSIFSNAYYSNIESLINLKLRNNHMDYLIKIELIVVGIIITILVITGIFYLYTKNKRVSKFLEKIIDFLTNLLRRA